MFNENFSDKTKNKPVIIQAAINGRLFDQSKEVTPKIKSVEPTHEQKSNFCDLAK